ncbi:sigma 54-interacting response regulator [Chitinophaga horti]|uniref:Sigma 54-interacting response regulator n=1 Tax=Chitinophaga horti TaxID=2920382 RepID=A0ABY6J5C1_9BACT|nr:sigma 54-interacting response regulator [Chitinophaga horti]UYQ94875.1 sigma 54-interacting response regulator [Chitinophaga horti]
MNKKILIVEDEFIVSNDLRLILESAGYQVTGIADSVKQARTLIDTNRPDVVLLDIYLKGKETGIDLARWLSSVNIAFVYLSANSNQQVLEAARATQPYGFLVKPFRGKDVLVTLDIARYRHENSLEASLRREAQLEQQLAGIAAQSTDKHLRLLRVIQALQAHIPFDFITTGNTTPDALPYSGETFLRIGFEQYQPIDIVALGTITKLRQPELEAMQRSSALETFSAILNGAAFTQACEQNAMKQLYARSFHLVANLVIPLLMPDGRIYPLSFYSRRADAYQQEHLSLSVRLLPMLTRIIQSIQHHNVSTPPTPVATTGRQKNFANIVGNSHLLLSVLDLVSQVAPVDTSVLVLGESGTGKERIAQSIHELSARKKHPLVKVNCAALPANLIESELFGHEKGAFTGALERRIGKFEQAEGGTLFLDEIGEMPVELQVKLLRVLQEKEIERVGGKSTVKINVRFIAATNRNLEKEVAEGRFRLDLYYRLNVFPIVLPPLRERREDIAPLAQYFADKFAAKFNKAAAGISDKMMHELETWHWPGNIRELENVIEQSVILSDGKQPLQLRRPLGAAAQTTPTANVPLQTLEEVKMAQRETEKAYILSILKKTNGRIRGNGGAAEIMNLKPTTLESRIFKLGIRKEDLQ